MLEKAHHRRHSSIRSICRRIASFMMTRGFIVGALLVGEFFVALYLTANLTQAVYWFYVTSVIFSIGATIYLVSTRVHPSAKLAWAIFILVFPPVGGVMYILYDSFNQSPRSKARQSVVSASFTDRLPQNSTTWQKSQQLPVVATKQIYYLCRHADFPVYQGTKTRYLSVGEEFLASLLHDLQKAQHFIFLEYYIIDEGQMWNQILAVLRQKAAEGVEVRIMYDDIGCLFTLPSNYPKVLQDYHIHTAVFNRFHPFIGYRINNRDHRKIAVIDGCIGYTGGLNLADEYINAYPKHGHWKDTAVRLEGAAVSSLTLAFLQFWQALRPHDDDFTPYLTTPPTTPDDGFIQPFVDDPLDYHYICKDTYLNLINAAREEIIITTPYLVPDTEIITALKLAATSGVAVTIITPAIYDHQFVHLLTQSFYLELMETGVRIFEYTPGFMHSKTILVDTDTAVVGSINLDFRSLYLQYESAVFMHQTSACRQLRRDLMNTLQVSREIELADVKEIKLSTRLMRSIIRLFAPLI